MVQKSLMGESILTNTRRLRTNIHDHARFKDLTAVLLKTEIFWDVTSGRFANTSN
jgi:hypothetical protein